MRRLIIHHYLHLETSSRISSRVLRCESRWFLAFSEASKEFSKNKKYPVFKNVKDCETDFETCTSVLMLSPLTGYIGVHEYRKKSREADGEGVEWSGVSSCV